ncbi:MAG: hypothetical protein HQM10_26870 [Candidatus Riflebacteria bacterium]|nr:hypothetical protein [Candidatus Riflebacteria bacterium]
MSNDKHEQNEFEWQVANKAAGNALLHITSASVIKNNKGMKIHSEELFRNVEAPFLKWKQLWIKNSDSNFSKTKRIEEFRFETDAKLALISFHDPDCQKLLLSGTDNAESYFIELLEPLRCQRLAIALSAGTEVNILGLWRKILTVISPHQKPFIEDVTSALLSTYPHQKAPVRLTDSEFSALAAALNDQLAFGSILKLFSRKWYHFLPNRYEPATSFKPNVMPEKNDVRDQIKSIVKTSSDECQYQKKLIEKLSVSEKYHVFRKTDDRIIRPEALVTTSKMKSLWKEFCRKSTVSDHTARLAARLRNLLPGINASRIEFEQEEGWPHPELLSRMIVSPEFTRVFQKANQSSSPLTAFCILIDCSGSMKGNAMFIAAHCINWLIRVLEGANMTVLLQGFTTGSKGDGPSLKAWHDSGSSRNPGRVNETLHLVFKTDYELWRYSCHRLGALFEPSWQKENIDGEALAWASAGLLQRPEKRKILFVISDGAPFDHNTTAHNPKGYLEEHLHTVVSRISRTPVELAAIGLNYNIHRYYPNAVRISKPEELDTTLFSFVEEIILRQKAENRKRSSQ